jgi:hypothetical protein
MSNRRCYRSLLLCSFLCLLSTISGAQEFSNVLKTAETKVRLEAVAHGPRLSSLLNGTEVWSNGGSAELISEVEVAGDRRPVEWNLNVVESHADDHIVSYVYEASSPRLRLTWEWEVRSQHGPIEHQVRIENREARELSMPLPNGLAFNLHLPAEDSLELFYVEKGADAPSDLGTHIVPIPEKFRWEGASSSYAHPRTDATREIIPYFLVEHPLGIQTGFYVGVEFSGLVYLALNRKDDSLRGEVGLDPLVGDSRIRLKSGEVFETPRIFLGSNMGGPDAAANAVRRWVKEVLTNQDVWKDPHYPLTEKNPSGNEDDITEDRANRMIRDASDLGFEMFHIGGGWFRDIGDWHADERKFPHGLQPIADFAHDQALKFGISAAWSQAGLARSSGALNFDDARTRPWLTTDLPARWKPGKFKAQIIDIGDPPAKAWAMRETDRIVRDNKLDLLENVGYTVANGCDASDHPHAPPDLSNRCTRVDAGIIFTQSSNGADVAYHAARAYYEIQNNLRRSHPGLLLEICNDGGRMVDFGSAAHGDLFCLSDATDPISNRQAFYDASYALPTSMLQASIESWPDDRKNPALGPFRYMLRSGMMGAFRVLIDATTWDADHRAAAKREIEIYKTQLRPLIREADLYHISSRPDGIGWDAIEYYNPKTAAGVVYAFRGATKTEIKHRFALRGLDATLRYRVRFQDHSRLTSGIVVQLPTATSSEIIFFDAIPAGVS